MSELTIILVSLGGIILTATVSLGGIILTQFRASHRDLDEKLTGIRAELGRASRKIDENRDRISRVEVSLTERIGQCELSLTERIARVEGNVDVLREHFVGKGRRVA